MFSKQQSKNLINTLLQNSEDQEFLNKTINDNIDKIGQDFFDALEEAAENSQYENKDESTEFLLNLGETLFPIINENDSDTLVEESLDALYSMDDLDEFILKNKENFSEMYVHSVLAEIEHLAVDYGKIETAFEMLDNFQYLVESIEQNFMGFVFMCRVNILNDYARYDEALSYIEKALDCFEANSYEEAETLATKGEILEDISIIKYSTKCFHRLRKTHSIHCDSLVGNHKILGTLYQKNGDFYKASKHLNIAIELSEKGNVFLETKIALLYDYSTLKIEQGHYSEASTYLYYIYVVSEKFNFHKMMFEALYGLANNAMLLGDLEEAREYIIKASEINNHIDRELELAYCYYVLGQIEFILWKKKHHTKSVRKAIVSFNRAIKLLAKSEDTKLYSEILYELGVICKEQEKLTKAMKYFKDALNNTESSNYESYIYSELALLYASQGSFSHALEYFEKANNLISEAQLKEKSELYFVQGQIYFMQEEHTKALESFQKTIKLYDQIGVNLQEKRMIYYGDKANIFLFSIATAHELKNYKVAFETLEKSKSKYFLEMLQRKANNPVNNSLDYETLVNQLEKEKSMEEIFKLKKKLNKHAQNMKTQVENLTFEKIKKIL